MKTIILGSGIIGIMSAYYLKKSGHDVIVIDRQKGAALETSFSNGGQISVCYSEPWSNFNNLKKMVSWIGKEDSPLLFKPHFDINQWRWGVKFLQECIPTNNHNNIISMLKIATYSRNCLQQLRKEYSLEYNQNTSGILTYYTSLSSFESAKKDSLFMQKYGCNRLIKSKEETLNLVPSFNNSLFEIFGSDYTEEDESGDAYLFTNIMKKKCEEMGVQFIFNANIFDAHLNKENIITSISFTNNNNYNSLNDINILEADNFVCCMGSYSPLFLSKLNLHYDIYPAKGYSATIDITDGNSISNISLTDSDKKIVFTKLGNKLRIAGTAEFNGYNLELNKTRCEVLLNRTKEIYPQGLDFSSVSFWTGLRPSTPGNVPIIKKTKIKNLYINSGHGTLGWTMGCGSGKLISQIINKTKLYDME